MVGDLSDRIQISVENFTKSEIPPFPRKNMLLEISNYCNHRCVFCANKKMTRKRGFMSLEFADRILREAYALGVREIGLYATGEPLTNPKVSEYVRIAKSIGYSYIYLTTNGALLDEEKFITLIQAGLDSIKFSINAGTSKTYEMIHGRDDFEKVIRIIEFAYRYRKETHCSYKIYASCVLTQPSISEKEILVQRVGHIVDEVIFMDVLNQGGMMYEINDGLILEKNRHKFGLIPCPTIFNAITVTCEGYLSACCVDFQNYLIVADLNHTSMMEAWTSELFQDLRRRHLENRVEGTLCYNCIYNKNDPVSPITKQYATMFCL